jgi:hypothetical protein
MSEPAELPPEFDRDAFDRCLDLFWSLIEDPSSVRLTVTSEFEKTVKSQVKDPEYAAAYAQDRPLGFALAKTIDQSDGSIDLVVEANIFHISKPHGPPEAVFEHEAYHVQVAQRGESLNNLRLRHLGEEMPVHPDLVAMAGVASEEYRVERLLAAAGHEGRDIYSDGFEEVARILYREVEKACRAYQGSLDVESVFRSVLNGFHALVTHSAYVAAELAAKSASPIQFGLDQEVDDLMLGPPWREVLEALMRLPAANEPTNLLSLDAFAFEVAERVEAWLEHFGFTVEQVDDGGTRFEILAPAQWMVDSGI